MRRLARWTAFGLLLGLGCTTTQAPVTGPKEPLKIAQTGKVLAVAFDDIVAEASEVVPLSLTASDGTGLKLVELKGRAILDDPLAFTELTLTFENPEDRMLEGTFSIVLPQGAAISRFAMKNDAGFQEGEVVEKQQARRAYEDFLHRRQDPALLEQAGGNEFSARVFPIPARGKKELIVSFSQELSKRTPFVLPLKGLPEIDRIDVEVYVAGKAAPVASLSNEKAKPESDLRVDAKLLGNRVGVRNGNLVLTRVTPIVGSQPEPLGAALLLVDTSASRALGMVEQGRSLRRLCAAVARSSGPKTPIVVAAYDQAIEPIYEGAAADFGDASIDAMRQRLALGASNLEAALTWAAEHARSQSLSRVVLLTDGVATAGETTGEKLRERAAKLKASGVVRLDAIALGGIRDDALLKSIVSAGLPSGGVVLDPTTMNEEEVWRRLNEATRSGVPVKVENAVFTFPEKIDGVQSGDEVLVYSNVPDDKPVRISVGGGPAAEPTLVKVERPLLERAWVGAKIRSLVERERVEGASPALSREIVGLSTRYRVLSPKTSLLVLETDRDYERFGIDRRALADILVADGGRVSLLKRTQPNPPKRPPVVVATNPRPKPKPAKQETPTWTSRPGTSGPPKLAMKKPAIDDDAGEKGAPGGVPGGVVGGVVGGTMRGAAAPSPSLEPMAEKEKSDGYGYEFQDDPQGRAPSPVASVAPPRDERPAMRPAPPPPAEPAPMAEELEREERTAEPEVPKAAPYTGPFKTVMDLLAAGQVETALKSAFDWRKTAPGDVMALVALGEGFEAAGDLAQAARCYGSVIDLFPSRADLRRFVGERLERLQSKTALGLATDTYRKAEEERPDHPASHRLLAYALVKQGKPADAFEAIVRGLHQRYPEGRFRGVVRILQEDLGLIGAAWANAEPARAADITARVRNEGGSIEDQPSLRFVLNWETDANDVDFHIYDGKGGHAFYSSPSLGSGGELYADVTTGYGPECFTIRSKDGQYSGPYRLQAHYYSRGPMGYGMGKLQIIEHNGKGQLTFEERPFIVMIDSAFVDLGVVKK